MALKTWNWSARAALAGGAQWVWIPFVYAVYPWGLPGTAHMGISTSFSLLARYYSRLPCRNYSDTTLPGSINRNGRDSSLR